MKQLHGYLEKMKRKKQDLATVLSNLAESLRIVSVLISPFLPSTN